ncbi:glycosyltransferase [Neobacillus mesonae]|nr:glycosyltransferase [Neobacillus mesonae]
MKKKEKRPPLNRNTPASRKKSPSKKKQSKPKARAPVSVIPFPTTLVPKNLTSSSPDSDQHRNELGTELFIPDLNNTKGIRLALLIPKDEQLAPTMESFIVDSFRMVVKEVILLKINENLYDCLSTYRPELFLSIGNQAAASITPDLLPHSSYTKTAVWLNDSYESCLFKKSTYRDWDLVITQNIKHIPVYQKFGFKHIAFVPFSADSAVYHPKLTEPEVQSDVLIVGNFSEDRLPYVNIICSRFNGQIIRAIGQNWDKVESIEPCEADNETMISSYYNGANIIVNWNAIPLQLYEIASCGVFQLVESNIGDREVMKPGEDIEVYTTPEQLDSKLQYYSENADKKRVIASKALYGSKYNYSLLHNAMRSIHMLTRL